MGWIRMNSNKKKQFRLYFHSMDRSFGANFLSYLVKFFFIGKHIPSLGTDFFCKQEIRTCAFENNLCSEVIKTRLEDIKTLRLQPEPAPREP